MAPTTRERTCVGSELVMEFFSKSRESILERRASCDGRLPAMLMPSSFIFSTERPLPEHVRPYHPAVQGSPFCQFVFAVQDAPRVLE